MSWAVLLLSLTSLCTYSAAQVSLTQPVSESVKLGETQQKAGNHPRYLLYYLYDFSKHQGDGVPDRFSGSKDSPNNVGYLTIKGALLEDDSDYYCSVYHPPSSSLHSGVLL
ncbi:hypothetical protein XELAEV_18007647mg [Xenopus laevis]|uniref:Immunoglobulin V-set domain-containing protein n=1 Tax=Xenopus laevis TaxID=8355 RepID=A0A974I4N5_XENLA|nr:hypothetical protein XELAEV_18007647mg [Xenopus laevis]